MNELTETLMQQFDASQVAQLDAVVAFALTESKEEIRLRISQQQCRVTEEQPTWTIYLENESTAVALLRDEVAPIDLFMHGNLRSSGYIVTTFQVLRAFTRSPN